MINKKFGKRMIVKMLLASSMLLQKPNPASYAQNIASSMYERLIAEESVEKKSLDSIIEDVIRNSERISKYRTIDGYNLKFLTKAIIDVESRGNEEIVSSQGAVGLMQLMPQTINSINKGLNRKHSAEDMKNPEINIEYGLNHLLDKYSEYEDKRKGDRVKFAVGGYIGVPRSIKSKKIRTWNDAVKNISYWSHDKYGTNAKKYVFKVMNNYYKYSKEQKTIQIARIN